MTNERNISLTCSHDNISARDCLNWAADSGSSQICSMCHLFFLDPDTTWRINDSWKMQKPKKIRRHMQGLLRYIDHRLPFPSTCHYLSSKMAKYNINRTAANPLLTPGNAVLSGNERQGYTILIYGRE